jgi:hypothetical protein
MVLHLIISALVEDVSEAPLHSRIISIAVRRVKIFYHQPWPELERHLPLESRRNVQWILVLL